MKAFAKFLLAGGLALGSSFASDSAMAQYCHSNHPGFVSAPSRFVHFRVDGRAFAFDRVTSGIFCDGVKIGERLPNGQVTIFEGALQGAGGVAAVGGRGVGPGAVGGPVGGAAGGPVGGAVVGSAGPQVGPGQQGTPVGPAAGGPAAGPGNPGSPPAAGAPAINAQPAPGASGVAPAPAPASAGPIAVPSLGSGNDPLSAAAQAGLPQINVELLTGQWRAETKDITGRVVVRELSFDEDNTATLRVQAQGQDPISIQGPFEMTGGQLVVSEGEDKRPLGQFTTVEQDRLVLQGEGETVTFTRVEEAAE